MLMIGGRKVAVIFYKNAYTHAVQRKSSRFLLVRPVDDRLGQRDF